MNFAAPTQLAARGVLLRPLRANDEAALAAAAADGRLWELRVTSVPEPGQTARYIADALALQDAGSRLPFVVIDQASGQVIGSTSYHDILPNVRRLEIGVTWYAKRWQRTHVNPSCKLTLMTLAF